MNSNAKDVALGFAGGLAVGTVIGGLLARRAGASSVPKLPQLTLHLYDHCPFCIRVELVLGWKGIPYERRVYGYGDTLGSLATVSGRALCTSGASRVQPGTSKSVGG